MIILDLETTGTDPQKHAIIDLAAMDFDNPSYVFHQPVRIFSKAEIQDEALAYNGFTLEEIKDPKRPSLQQVLSAFISWLEPIKDRTFAGQNPDFDVNFLKTALKHCQFEIPLSHRKLDQHTLAYTAFLKLNKDIPLDETTKQSLLNSDAIMEFVGLPPEPKPHHSALNGVLWEAEAFSRLIYGKNLLPRFRSYKLPTYLKK